MLTITPSLNMAAVAPYCAKCGQPYSAAYYLYRAENRGQLLAAALFRVGGDRVDALLYETEDADDAFLLDGLLRAGFHYASEQGIENGCIPEHFREANRALFASLNYPVQAVFNITNFFAKYKNCAGR